MVKTFDLAPRWRVATCGLVVLLAATAATAREPRPAIPPGALEADWLRQAEVRDTATAAPTAVRPPEDAAGGVDGVKNGQWGFHTALEESPWWQVDLGAVLPLARLRLYNRTELAERADHVEVLLSSDAKSFHPVWRNEGKRFLGHADGKPLVVELGGEEARHVRLRLPGRTYFHLDEVEIEAVGSPRNVALGRPATQSSTSQWSVRHDGPAPARHRFAIEKAVRRGLRLAQALAERGLDTGSARTALEAISTRARELASGHDAEREGERELYLRARRTIRDLLLSHPLLDFDSVLFVKRAPGMLPHVSDQYYGWWSRPGGGLCRLDGLRGPRPTVRCLTSDWPAGSFLRPDLSPDAQRVLFAYARYHPEVASKEKVDKEALPEDAFYHIFEMRLDTAQTRQITRGRYDDMDARYLPDGGIVFLSTRKGLAIPYDERAAAATLTATRPDSYVRCGGDNHRPCAVYTLHVMESDGSGIRPISAFENFEWTPSVSSDGDILYARWDYIDRFNGAFMSLWATRPDGAHSRLVYGNYTKRPQCVFEARSVPGSDRIVFTATAHHSITGGSLVLLDRSRGTEGETPITRLTPEVVFPETEGWPSCYYSGPWPLSEDLFLCAWSDRKLPPHAGSRPVTGDRNPVNASGIYLYDVFGNLELLHRDPEISSLNPIPIRPRARPPELAKRPRPERPAIRGHDPDAPLAEGTFLVQDVDRGLAGTPRGTVKRLRVVGVVPKPQPFMNSPRLGVSREDPGKFVLGTAPVEPDGSAFFRVPSGIPLFFQALDAEGRAVQTMRSLAYVQPGESQACAGCHESRDTAPPAGGVPLAARREPSRLEPGPEGSWPLRFDRLVQPVLDRSCVSCHRADSERPKAAALDLSSPHAWSSLVGFGGRDIEKLAFERDRSIPGKCVSRQSRLLALLRDDELHRRLDLSTGDLDRIVLWLDTYAQELGSFSREQERELERLRHRLAPLLAGGR